MPAKIQDRIVPLLLETQSVSADDVERARRLATSDRQGHGLPYHLVKIQAISSRDVVIKLAEQFKVRGWDFATHQIDEETLAAVPKELVIEHRVVPVSKQGRKLYVATADPTDVDTLDKIRFATQLQITPLIADEYALEQFIEQRFTKTPDIGSFLAELAQQEGAEVEVVDPVDVAELARQEEVDQKPLVKFINEVLTAAVKKGASDIHFEFFETYCQVRLRIDGSLVEFGRPPKQWDKGLTTRLKVMAKLNISERRVPQDGRTRLKVGSKSIDFRVSTLPTAFGEKIVLRILDRSAVALDLTALGIDGREQEVILRTIRSPYGMLMVTGPTGSGKTTTLYSMLNYLNRTERNIVTVEDPIEYDLPGVNQVPVKPEVGLDFATTLKAFLRQDPNVIMVGEMRDLETAKIGLRAALTGHLVLTTMHTFDAASAVTRLAEMGIDRFDVATATSAIVAQRLVRKVCAHCIAPTTYTEAEFRLAQLSPEDVAGMKFFKGRGCPACNQTGYKGRVGLYEVLEMTDDIRELVLGGHTTTEIKQRAVLRGMRTLRTMGLARVREGKTTLDEVVKETAV